ncbi:serine carboxypeptidase [Peniophora sp. CONT]|nr:serine carboxypeptidase [Peniophora sp. CONT]
MTPIQSEVLQASYGSSEDYTPKAAKRIGTLRVKENSGVCETTPGVYQASGYADIAENKSIWFWFFAARHDPENKPLVAWFNGGPGATSMIGLFSELGPCRTLNDSSGMELNPTSWSEFANIIFIDSPVGVGYSQGSPTVSSAREAAEDIWTFFQTWFSDARFSKYIGREFGIWTESYGGHYGPAFSEYFLEQNGIIAQGLSSGHPVNLKYLGIGNGLTDALLQYPKLIEYAAHNPYHPLVSQEEIETGKTAFWGPGGCRERLLACEELDTDAACSNATVFCNDHLLFKLNGNWDQNYVLTPRERADEYPSNFIPWLTSSEVVNAIGAELPFTPGNQDIAKNFQDKGDWMRSTKPRLERVIDAGVRVILYVGDADFLCNYMGVEVLSDNLQTRFSTEYAKQEWANFTVNSVNAGIYKNAGTFSYARLFGAGHLVPAYGLPGVPRGAAALQMFSQVMSNQSIGPT